MAKPACAGSEIESAQADFSFTGGNLLSGQSSDLSGLGWAKAMTAIITLIACILIAVLSVLLHKPSMPPRTLAAYATDLDGRTPHQQFNARRAAHFIDGTGIAPGQIFSFNQILHGWSADRGFLRAPVSYDGILVDDYGGGVCQTSTTIYNAALLAGLPIVERHAHTFAPSYAPPGRDAAVAYANVDLRFRNPYPYPLTLRVGTDGRRLVCRLIGSGTIEGRVALESTVLDRFPAGTAPVRPGAGSRRSRWHLTGRDGVRVAIYRAFDDSRGASLRRELVSDNTYQPISRAEWATP